MTEAHAITLPHLRIRLRRLGYREAGGSEERPTADEPFAIDVPRPDLLPRWAR